MPFDAGPTRKHTRESVLLLRAAEVISDPNDWSVGREKRGLWWQRKRYCVVGSVRRAAQLYQLVRLGGTQEVKDILDKAAIAHGFADAASMNDHPDTTHEMIMQLLREASDLAMSDHV